MNEFFESCLFFFSNNEISNEKIDCFEIKKKFIFQIKKKLIKLF